MIDPGWIGVTLGIKAGALIAVGLLLARALAPAQRLAFLRAVLLAVLALPLLSGMLPPWLLPLLPAAESFPLTAVTPVAASPPAANGGDWPAWPLAAYGFSVVFLLGRFVSQFQVLRRWARRARPLSRAEMGGALSARLDSQPRLRIGWSDRVASPVSFGWPTSDVLLPAAWRGETGARVIHALAHELAHVERRDWLWLVLIRMTHALVWWNPLLYPLLRSLDEETELACDRRALERVRSPADYARSLLSLAREPTLAAVPMSGRRYWRRRVEHAFSYRSEEFSMTRIPMACASILIAALMLPLAACQLVRAAEPVPPAADAAPVVTDVPRALDSPSPDPVAKTSPVLAAAPPTPAAPEAVPLPDAEVNPAVAPSPTRAALPPSPERAAERAALREREAAVRRAEAEALRVEAEARRHEFKSRRAEMDRRREAMAAERARLMAEQGERRERLAQERAVLAGEHAAMAREAEAMRAELQAVQRELEETRRQLAEAQEKLERAR